jgi:hypothetical protein
MARARARHGDLTARTKADLVAKHANEQEQAQRRMAMIDAQAAVRKDEVVDLTPNPPHEDDLPPVKPALPQEEPVQEVGGVEEATPVEPQAQTGHSHGPHVHAEVDQTTDVEVEERKVVIRVNEDCPAVTIGYGKTYDFVEGQRYRVPLHVYEHLEEKGLVYH